MSTEARERAARLRERVEQDYAQKWEFDEIPTISGVVESIKAITLDGPNGPERKVVVTIAEPEGERYGVWLSQRALYNQFLEQRIVEGEFVAIRYLGEADTHQRGMSPAKRFRVEVDRGGANGGNKFDWDSVETTSQSTTPSPADDGPVSDEELTRAQHEAAMEAAAAGEDFDRAPVPDDIPY